MYVCIYIYDYRSLRLLCSVYRTLRLFCSVYRTLRLLLLCTYRALRLLLLCLQNPKAHSSNLSKPSPTSSDFGISRIRDSGVDLSWQYDPTQHGQIWAVKPSAQTTKTEHDRNKGVVRIKPQTTPASGPQPQNGSRIVTPLTEIEIQVSVDCINITENITN